jgi:hypothetical protein
MRWNEASGFQTRLSRTTGASWTQWIVTAYAWRKWSERSGAMWKGASRSACFLTLTPHVGMMLNGEPRLGSSVVCGRSVGVERPSLGSKSGAELSSCPQR